MAFLKSWQHILHDGGWVGLAWPQECGGRGATLMEQVIFNQAMARAKAPPLINVLGIIIAGPTIMVHGTEAQKRRYLPKILNAEEIWCQGFSEPNSGSDLASLATSARLDGDEFVVNGQKVWNSYGHMAQQCLLLVRTNPDLPKHRGITALVVDMQSPGVTVKPLRQITGDAEFNEIFFDNVRVPRVNLLGDMKVWVENAKSVVHYAAWAVDCDAPEASRAASMAKAYGSEMYTQVTADGIQVHGGVGFTWDHCMHLYFKRAKSSEVLLRNTTWHRERTAALIPL